MRPTILLALLLLVTLPLWGETVTVTPQSNGVQVTSSGDVTTLQLHVGQFDRTPVTIDGTPYYQLSLASETATYNAGEPELPKVTRSLAIGDDAKMAVRVVSEQYVDYNMNVVPSKGAISRTIDPATVPYLLGNVYQTNAFYPVAESELGNPYIMRDIRGITVTLYPIRYNPVTGVVRVYTDMTVEVYRAGTDTENVKTHHTRGMDPAFTNLYQQHFVNWTPQRTVTEQGNMLVICYSGFMDSLQAFVDWKNQKGIPTELVDVSTIGTTASQIKTYIQNLYNEGNLAYVLLVGDAAQIPTFSSGGGGSDPTYSLLEGSDNYPDIVVGRFSAENVAQAATQVRRTITYERDLGSADWEHQGMGIASNAGGGGQGDDGESDQQHIENLRTQLLGYTYTSVDQVYENQGATTQDILDGLNDGRSIINYCGHGADTYWVTTGFSVTNINSTALHNDNMLPFIFSVACVNGNFTGQTCFAEAWLRAVDTNNQPKGAIGTYMSSINQDWQSPMEAQDYFNNSIVTNLNTTYGALCYNSSCDMMDEYGASSGSSGCDMFLTWHVFGDPSVQIRTATPVDFVVDAPTTLFMGASSMEVQTDEIGALVCLSYDHQILANGYTDNSGHIVLNLQNMPTDSCTLTLTITALNKATYLQDISYMPASGPYLVAHALVADTGSGINYNATNSIGVNVENIGVDVASGVTGTLTSTDPYVTVVDGSGNLGNVAAGANVTIPAMFTVQVAANVPDQYVVSFNLTLTDSANSTWTRNLTMLANAPILNVGVGQVQETNGDNDGVFEPGETANYSMYFDNVGHAASPAGNVTIACNDPRLIISETTTSLPIIAAQNSGAAVFTMTLSDSLSNSTLLPVGIEVVAAPMEDYHAVTNVTVGSVYEGFENNMASFDWLTTPQGSTTPWSISTDSPYVGLHCLKSGVVTNSQQSGVQVTVDIPSTGTLSFAYKVSSEESYDYLRLYIDNYLIGQWSGELPWTTVSYTVSAGTHTLLWKYVKDYQGSAGSDCAWIDDIYFPHAGGTAAPIIVSSVSSFDFGTVAIGSTNTQDFTLANLGNLALTGSISLPDGYTLIQPTTRARETQRHSERETYNFSIAAGETQTMTLQFAPTEAATYNGTMLITSNDPFAEELPISLQGTTSNGDSNQAVLTNSFKGVYPNPFNPETTLQYSLAKSGQVSLEIYNVRGQLVRTLVKGSAAAGAYSVKWNGTNNAGANVGSGVYFAIFNTDNGDQRYTVTKKMLLLK